MLHAAFVRSPHPHARVGAVDATAVPDGRVVLTPRRRRRPRPLRLPGQGPARARGPGPPRRRRRRGRRRAHPRAGARGRRGRRGDLRGAAGGVRPGGRRSRAAPPLVHEQPAASGRGRRVDRRPADPAHERLPPLPHPPRRRRRRASRRPTWSSRRSTARRRRARADGAARRARRVGGRAADAVERHADAVQHARRPRRAVRHPRGADPRHRAPDGRLVRGEDVRAPGGARRRAGPQGRPPGQGVLDRAEEFVTLNRHPAACACGSARAATGRSSPRRSTAGSTPARTPTAAPGVATKMGYAGVGPYRIPHVRVDSLAIYTNLPPNGAYRGYGAMQSVWASERTMDLLAARAGHEPARAAPHEPAARRRRVRHRRGHARRALRGVPAGGRRRRRLRGGPARQGPVRAAEGHADAEPRGDQRRAHAGRLHRPQRVLRDGPGRPAVAAADGRRAARAASPVRSRSPTPTPTRRRTTRARRRAARPT